MNFDFSKGFRVYHDSDKNKQFPVEWMYRKEYSNDKRSVYQAYDANLCPLPDIKTWKPEAIKEICKKVSELFTDCDSEIYLDGYLLDVKMGTLSDRQFQR